MAEFTETVLIVNLLLEEEEALLVGLLSRSKRRRRKRRWGTHPINQRRPQQGVSDFFVWLK